MVKGTVTNGHDHGHDHGQGHGHGQGGSVCHRFPSFAIVNACHGHGHGVVTLEIL